MERKAHRVDEFSSWYSASETSSEQAGDLDRSDGSAGSGTEIRTAVPSGTVRSAAPPQALPSFISTKQQQQQAPLPPTAPSGRSYLPTLNQMRSIPSFARPPPREGEEEGIDDSGSSDALSQSAPSTVDSQSTVDTAGINETIAYYGQEISRKPGTVQNLTIGSTELYMWKQEPNQYADNSFYESTGDNEISQSFSTML
jgi:hypothetical protein